MPVPLVLLPGMNCSPRLWDGVVRELLGVDRPDGHARQVVVPEVDRPTLGEQVESLLDHLPRRFAIGGLSLGAIVAMAVHRRAPERVAGLFLVATNAQPPIEAQRSAWAAQLDSLAGGSLATGPTGGAAPAPRRSATRAGPGRPDPGAGRRRRRGRLCGPSSSSSRPASTNDRGSPEPPFPAPSSRRRRTASARSNGISRSTTGRRIGASRRPGRSAPCGVVAPAPVGRGDVAAWLQRVDG